MSITLAPEILFRIGGIGITNSVFTSLIVHFIILALFIYIVSTFSYKHPGKFQLVIETLINGLYGMLKDIMGSENAKKYFGLVFSLFIFILISNWFGLLPIALTTSINHHQAKEESAEIHEVEGVDFMKDCLSDKKCYITTSGIQKFKESLHVFRAPSSDLSATLSLALISVFSVNFIGLKELKLKYLKKFIYILNIMNLIGVITGKFSNSEFTNKQKLAGAFGEIFTFLVNSFVGLLEIVSEFGKIISFSFRLLGNIFAGEVLLAILTSLTFGLATLPFLGLEIFVGIIQALVFFMLTSVFISLAISEH